MDMQIFLPYRDINASADALDDQRLLNQINEALIIYRALTGESPAWRSHPIVKMWDGCHELLNNFRFACMAEARSRGFNYNWQPCAPLATKNFKLPDWWQNEKVFAQYRANLLYKDYVLYDRFMWAEYPSDKRLYIVNGEEKWIG